MLNSMERCQFAEPAAGTRLIWLLVVIVVGLGANVQNSARAQDMQPASGDIDDSFEKNQRRLLIAGWTTVGVGLGVGFGAIAAQERGIGAAIGVGALGGAMMLTGGGLLIRRRLLRKRHHETLVADRGPNLFIQPGLGSVAIAGRF